MSYIKGFDALRAISIGLVVFAHLNSDFLLPNTAFAMERIWPLMSGDFGVRIFFVISGFLITSIVINERTKTGTISLKNFFARRFLRLLPPLFIFFILIVFANLFGYLTNAKESILYAIFYIYNFVPRSIYSTEMGHLWSLGVEEQFYLIWPLLLLVISSKKKLLILLLALVIFSNFLLFIHFQKPLFADYHFTRWFIPASSPILIGCMIAILNLNFKNQLTKWMQHTWKILLFCIVTYTFPLYSPTYLLAFTPFIHSLLIGGVLLFILHRQSSKFVQLLDNKPLNYIGKISYGIYVYQGFFLRTGGYSEVWFQKFPVSIVLTLIIAIISYETIEKPILKLKSKFV